MDKLLRPRQKRLFQPIGFFRTGQENQGDRTDRIRVEQAVADSRHISAQRLEIEQHEMGGRGLKCIDGIPPIVATFQVQIHLREKRGHTVDQGRRLPDEEDRLPSPVEMGVQSTLMWRQNGHACSMTERLAGPSVTGNREQEPDRLQSSWPPGKKPSCA